MFSRFLLNELTYCYVIIKSLKNKAVFPLKLFFEILKINQIIKSRLPASASFFEKATFLNLRCSRPQSLCGFPGKHPNYTTTVINSHISNNNINKRNISLNSNDNVNNINIDSNRSIKKSWYLSLVINSKHDSWLFAYQFRQL